MHFKIRLILLTDANPKRFIVMNNAYYGLNLAKFLKINVLQMENNGLRCL